MSHRRGRYPSASAAARVGPPANNPLEPEDERPGLAAVAIRPAELLDNPLAMPQHPAAAGRLVEPLVSFSRHQQPQVRLSAVRSMTKRK